MNEVKHLKTTLRVAEVLVPADKNRIVTAFGDKTREGIADLIERETHLGEVSDALRFALMTIEHRPGLCHRLDLFTADERRKLSTTLAKAKGGDS